MRPNIWTHSGLGDISIVLDFCWFNFLHNQSEGKNNLGFLYFLFLFWFWHFLLSFIFSLFFFSLVNNISVFFVKYFWIGNSEKLKTARFIFWCTLKYRIDLSRVRDDCSCYIPLYIFFLIKHITKYFCL